MTQPKLHLYNTLTRTKEPFTPQDPKNVTMYVCGITPYDDAHIGHARAYVVFDVLYRTLRHIYGEDAVKYVRNFTDIDDKILARAKENGEDWQALASRVIATFHDDMEKLNTLKPNVEPLVTTSIEPIIALIQKLEEKGIAYPAADGIYYDTSKVPSHSETRCWCGLPRAYSYGKLSGKDKNELRKARIEATDGKRNPGDFALWKFAKEEEPETAKWPSPWGRGRPGWHIECSAMAAEHLGETIDIHGGGEDLQFPHHENEIAQSEGATGGEKPFANYWLHNGFITVNGTKMSKSLGNFTTIKDALKNYSPEAIRLWLLQTHYRKPVDYTDETLKAAQTAAKKFSWITQLNSYSRIDEGVRPDFKTHVDQIVDAFLKAITDDLNTPRALASFFELSSLNQAKMEKDRTSAEWEYLKNNWLTLSGILGIQSSFKLAKSIERNEIEDARIEILISQRNMARASRNWAESDLLRDELKAQGILLEDHPDGTTTWRRA